MKIKVLFVNINHRGVMELEKLRQLFENTTAFKTNPACMELAEQFEAMAELHYLHKDGIANDEYFERFGKCCNQFWTAFDKAVTGLGLIPEVLKANLNNPEFFHPEQWKAMQALKQEITGEDPDARKSKKLKKRNNQKNVRI